jgi:UDP-glucose 4-epimerase
MKALVTGGCGFIGSHLTRRLIADGHSVDVVDDLSSGELASLTGLKMRVTLADLAEEFFSSIENDPSLTVIQGDFSHSFILNRIESKEYDVVFHQAAIPRVLYSVENPVETSDVNLLSTVKLMEACAGNTDRLVFASSSSVYGGATNLPTSESTSKNPLSPYAWQKSCIEDLAKIFSNLYDLDVVCLRYFNAFGPGQLGSSPYSTAIAAWCNAVRDEKPLRSDGDGEQSRDLCYIDNIVEANILVSNSKKKFSGECYNIACGDRTSNNEILEWFSNNFKNIEIISAPERQGDVKHTQADISLAKKDFGYEPIVRFWDGLEKTIEWWDIN